MRISKIASPASADGGYELAAKMAQDIATNVLSNQAENLTDPIFAALGISSGSDDSEKYFEQVMGELTKIEGTLSQITAKLQSISSGISVIENALTGISSQITDAELQSRLAQYVENENVINQNYQTYAASLAAMGSSATFRQGTAQLFDLFQSTNADNIATAMRNISALMVGEGELRGIISYQPSEFGRALGIMASDLDQITRVMPENAYYPAGNWGRSFPDGSMIIDNIPNVLANTFASTIIPALKAALTVQLKGLNFLCAAWGGTVNESSLSTITGGISDVITAIGNLFTLFDFDQLTATVLQANGPRLAADIIGQPWGVNGHAGTACPFDESWIQWTQILGIAGLSPVMVQTPWVYGNVPSYVVANQDWNEFVELPDGSFTSCEYGCLGGGDVAVVRPSSLGITQPTNFAAFLSSLPASAYRGDHERSGSADTPEQFQNAWYRST